MALSYFSSAGREWILKIEFYTKNALQSLEACICNLKECTRFFAQYLRGAK